jgi:hypothetical protein
VLKEVMKIIRETNGGKHSAGELPVSRIDHVRIGKSAQKLGGQVAAAAGGSAGSAAHDGMPVEEGPVEYEEPVGLEGEYETGQEAGEDPADGRYVDMENNKLSGQQLRGTTSGEAGTQQGTLAVAKRIPVEMRLLIHQLKIPKLLVECGNSPLTVEVQQMRINPTSGTTRRERGGAAMSGTTGSQQEHRDYVTVELYGIISVYNPVDYSALGVEQESVDEAGEGAEETDSGGDTQPADAAGATTDAGTEAAATDAGGPTADARPDGTGPGAAGAAVDGGPATPPAAESPTP